MVESLIGKNEPKILYFVDENYKLIPYKRKNFVRLYCYYNQQFRSFISHNFPFRHFQLKFRCCFAFVFFIAHADMMCAFFVCFFFFLLTCFASHYILSTATAFITNTFFSFYCACFFIYMHLYVYYLFFARCINVMISKLFCVLSLSPIFDQNIYWTLL